MPTKISLPWTVWRTDKRLDQRSPSRNRADSAHREAAADVTGRSKSVLVPGLLGVYCGGLLWEFGPWGLVAALASAAAAVFWLGLLYVAASMESFR